MSVERYLGVGVSSLMVGDVNAAVYVCVCLCVVGDVNGAVYVRVCLCVVFAGRPDMILAVDWALTTHDVSLCLQAALIGTSRLTGR